MIASASTTRSPGSADLYQFCVNDTGTEASATELLQCVVANLEEPRDPVFTRNIFLVLAAALAFFMQAGFAMVCAGAVRRKNVQNTMMKNLLDACGSAVSFFAIGYAFAFGGSNPDSTEKSFVGNSNFFLINVEDYAFFLFQYAFSAASTTIVAGTLAERCQMAAYMLYSIMLSGWVYPIIVRAFWSPNGFLSATSIDPLWGVGVVDFAGSGVVHLTGGATAILATKILGPRRGRFHDDTGRPLEIPKEFPGHSIGLQMLGTFILWLGWYGFNGGSALLYNDSTGQSVALAGVNTAISGGSAALVALFLNLLLVERYTGEAVFDLKRAMNGALSGLVAITAGCGVVEPWAACIIGGVAGMLYLGASNGLLLLRLDDAVDAIPVHMVNGIWGLLSVGIFAAPRHLLHVYGRSEHAGLIYIGRYEDSDVRLLGAQVVGILFILGWVTTIMFPFFVWLDWRGWFRSDPLEEIVGLDTSYHGGLVLLNPENGLDVKPEYIDAFQKRREETLRRRQQQVTSAPSTAKSSLPASIDPADDFSVHNEEEREEDHEHDEHDGA